MSGGIENLKAPSSTEEAREWGRRGGIASGEARRRRASLREELLALLSADDGVVAKSIVVAICREAKQGNVGAFKAIAQVMGELKEVVETQELPPPFVIEVHDPEYVEAERKRQEAAMAAIADSLMTAETRVLTAPTAAESTETTSRATRNAPQGADEQAHGTAADAPEAPSRAAGEADDWAADFDPPSQAPRTPSEARAMRRAMEAKEGRSDGGGPQPYRAVPMTLAKRRPS